MAEGDLERTCGFFETFGFREQVVQQWRMRTAGSLQVCDVIADHMKNPKDQRLTAKMAGHVVVAGADQGDETGKRFRFSDIIGR